MAVYTGEIWITEDSTELAFHIHQSAGKITEWHNWHEAKPGRKRPMFTVTLASGAVLDIASLWEAHALNVGLTQERQ